MHADFKTKFEKICLTPALACGTVVRCKEPALHHRKGTPLNTIAWLLLGFLLGLAFVHVAGRQAQNGRLLLAMGIVVGAWIYVPLAIAGKADIRWFIVEIFGAALYSSMAWAGIRYSVWWLVAGWATHMLWDIGLHQIGEGRRFTGPWYPLLCVAFDLVVAIYILYLIKQEKRGTGVQFPHRGS
jgi:hypothetical protein